jgi:hypothetical protein
VVEIDNVNNPNVNPAIPNRFQWNKGPANGNGQNVDPPIMTNSDIVSACTACDYCYIFLCTIHFSSTVILTFS